MPSFVEIGPVVPEKKNFEGFLPYINMILKQVVPKDGVRRVITCGEPKWEAFFQNVATQLNITYLTLLKQIFQKKPDC